MIRLFSDSSVDLPEELIEKYDIHMVPIRIQVDGHEYKDGVNVSAEKMCKVLQSSDAIPETSPCSLDDTMNAILPYLAHGDELIMFTISGSLSSTAEVFRIAAEELHVEDRITIIDSETFSAGIGILILEAAELIRDGLTREEIAAIIEQMKRRVYAGFLVDNPAYLSRSGEFSTASAVMSNLLKIHHVMELVNGEMLGVKKYQGKMSSAAMAYCKEMEKDLLKARKDRIFVFHSGECRETLKNVTGYLESLSCFDEILVTRAGAANTCHSGPGSVGIAFLKK